MVKNNLKEALYLVIYYDENGNIVRADYYLESQIKNYMEESDFQTLKLNKSIGIKNTEKAKEINGIDNYVITEL
jgi:hypothetical protein